MPLTLHRPLPIISQLQQEGLPVRCDPSHRGTLKIGFLNLMPEKEVAERHWLRLLAQTKFDLELHCLKLKQWKSKTRQTHLDRYYQDWDARDDLDALVITGAPLGTRDYDEVSYWQELRHIFDDAILSYASVMYLCWAANAAFYHHYGIPRVQRAKKISGVYEHRILRKHPIIEGIPRDLRVPHSRNAEARQNQMYAHPELRVLMDSRRAGAFVTIDPIRKRLFVLGHPEYEADTLHREFQRDVSRGLSPNEPEFYYLETDDESEEVEREHPPQADWQAHGVRLLENWLETWVR